ncbi:MAG TPA: 6-phosphofructokinase [Phycisphaerales bacterium]|nr:6-phosphofructokinase [Phycisphaerales bacterium]
MPPTRRIGLFTGGGDCPGLNAVIRAVTKNAILNHGLEVVGIEDGLLGLIENRCRPLSFNDVSGILQFGGTILGSSNKANPRRFPTARNPDGSLVFSDMTERCVEHARAHRIDAIVAIGGDGTMSACRALVERGLNFIGVPKSIDNDLFGTDLTFGFLTAVQIASDALDRVHTTASSHGRIMVVEVMGRNAGWISLYSGLAGGADVILIPEIPYDTTAIVRAIEQRAARGRKATIICIAEGAKPKGGLQAVGRIDPSSPDPVRLGGIGAMLAGELEDRTGQETRVTVLGHVQRGGTPTAADRVLATEFGFHAADLLASGARNRLIVRQDGRITDIDIADAADKQRLIPSDHSMLRAARAVGTCMGDEESLTE